MLPVLTCFVELPENFNGGIFISKISFMHISSLLLILPLFGDLQPLLEVLGVPTRIFLLMNYPHHCPSTVMRPSYIVTEQHTPTLLLLTGDML